MSQFDSSGFDSPGFDSAASAASADGAARTESSSAHRWLVFARLLVAGLLLGAVAGFIWWQVSPLPVLVVREDGIYPEAFTESSWFGADGWFLILGLAGGVLLAILGWRWSRRFVFTALMGLLIGGALMALVAWWLGGILGPSDPTTIDAAVGDFLTEPLGLRAMGVLFAPALAAVATFVFIAAATPAADPTRDANTDPVVRPGAA